MNIKAAGKCWIWILVLTPMSVWGQQTFTTRITYDNLAQIERFEFSDGSCVHYEYDNEIGLASAATFHAENSTTPFVDGVGLNQSGLVETVTIDGGQKAYDFDSLHQLVEQRFDYGGTTYYRAKDMAYNHWGGLKSLQRQDPSVNAGIQYGYTHQGQLRSFNLANQTATYRYDRFGNLTSVDGFNLSHDLVVPSYEAGANVYDERNRNAEWEYDNAGRLTKDDTKQYYYNAVGRLAMIRDLVTGIPLQSNLYDGAGNRVRTTDIRKGSITYTLRDATGDIITQRVDHADGPDQTTHFITHNGETIGEMTRKMGDPAFEKTQIFNDHLGSPAVVVNEAEIINYEYGPFGTQISEPKSTGAHGYTGHEDDKATGLTYMKARTYDSTRARFLTPDPARDFDSYRPASFNLFQYVRNDPINLIDPTGLEIDDSGAISSPQFGVAYLEYKEKLLSTESGKELWDALHESDSLFTVTFGDLPENQVGVLKNFKFDKENNSLISADLVLKGSSLTGTFSGTPPEFHYPFGSTLSNSGELKLYLVAHELGHGENLLHPVHVERKIRQLESVRVMREAMSKLNDLRQSIGRNTNLSRSQKMRIFTFLGNGIFGLNPRLLAIDQFNKETSMQNEHYADRWGERVVRERRNR